MLALDFAQVAEQARERNRGGRVSKGGAEGREEQSDLTRLDILEECQRVCRPFGRPADQKGNTSVGCRLSKECKVAGCQGGYIVCVKIPPVYMNTIGCNSLSILTPVGWYAVACSLLRMSYFPPFANFGWIFASIP